MFHLYMFGPVPVMSSPGCSLLRWLRAYPLGFGLKYLKTWNRLVQTPEQSIDMIQNVSKQAYKMEQYQASFWRMDSCLHAMVFMIHISVFFIRSSYGFHTVFIRFSYGLHTVFIRSYCLHTVFIRSSYGFHTVFIRLSNAFHMAVSQNRSSRNDISFK